MQSLQAGQKYQRAAVSFATERFFGINAFQLVDGSGKKTVFKYYAEPDAGFENLDLEKLKGMPEHYLFDDLKSRIKDGKKVSFTLSARLPNEGDTADKATDVWGLPEQSRKTIKLGEIKLESIIPDTEKQEKPIVFDARPGVKGVEGVGDPLIAFRSIVYAISGQTRCPHPAMASH